MWRCSSKVRVLHFSRILVMLCAMSAVQAFSAHAGEGSLLPGRAEAAALIRATLATVNDANQTGNYAVLRAKSAPAFQERFTTAKLEAMFQGMRDKHVDLSRALTIEPDIARARFHTGQQVLQFIGAFKMQPVAAQFVFSYQRIGGAWKLHGLNLAFEPASAAPQQVAKSPAI